MVKRWSPTTKPATDVDLSSLGADDTSAVGAVQVDYDRGGETSHFLIMGRKTVLEQITRASKPAPCERTGQRWLVRAGLRD